MIPALPAQGDGSGMTENWKLCVGHVVDGKFHLRQYLPGGELSAVFLTEYAEAAPVD
jgi:hypothetical protein